MTVKYNDEKSMISYMNSEFNSEPNIFLVVFEEELDSIIDNIEFKTTSFIKELEADCVIYLVTKITDDKNNIHVEIETIVFDENDELVNWIENDVVIIQDYTLDEQDIEDNVLAEEITIVDYEDDCEDINSEECQCETCQEPREMAKQETNLENCLHDCRFCNCCDEEELIESEDVITAKLEFIQEILEDFGEIELVTDYETTKAIIGEYSIFDYEDGFSIEIHEDVEGYLVFITEEKLFIIEPIERDGEYFHIDSECLYIDDDIEDYLEDEFYERYLHVDELLGIRIKELEA